MFRIVLIVLLAALATSPLLADDAEEGFRPLFSGENLDGWEGAERDAADCWQVEEGELVCTGKPGPWLRSREEFSDFELRFEYLLREGGNSGVYLRVPADGNHHGDGAGIEVQVLDDHAERYKDLKPYQYSGSLYAIVPAEPRVSKPAGEWNAMTIRCVGTKYEVHHNGEKIIDADEASAPELARRRTSGFLGLQNHNEEVRFRNLRLKDLSDASPRAESPEPSPPEDPTKDP